MQGKPRKTMKKSITIPNVDTDLYEAVKERCRQDGTSISAYFNSLLAGEAPTADESEKIKELTAQIVQLKTTLSKTERELSQANDEFNSLKTSYNEQENVCGEYEQENKKLLDYNDELKLDLTAKDAELEEAKKALETMKTQIESLRASSDDGVFVALTPLELALIKHVAEKEQARHEDKSITPSSLLKAMFVNYTIHGDMYFFPHPSKAILRALKAQVEEAEKNKRKNTEDEENNQPQAKEEEGNNE